MANRVKPGRKDTVLVGEDELEVRSYLATALRCHGYQVEFAEDGEEVLSYLHSAHRRVSALVLDIIMPHKDGLEVLREIRRFDKDLPIVMLSSVSSPLTVVEAMRCGATDFLGKPVTHDELANALKKALNGGEVLSEAAVPEPDSAGQNGFFAGNGRMRDLEAFVRQVGASEAPVLIFGETGSGKEVLARRLHANSPRATKPFLKLNCAALPPELVESELFGYDRGAFTGAFQKKAGIFELADGGTLLLDEIGDMDFKLQAKLLQVLQDQTFQHLGGKETVSVNVRVLAATHRDLECAIAEGSFREDLYYRLNVVSVEVPPLRECRQEIVPLAEFLLKRHCVPGAPLPTLPPALQQALLDYHWPGNVRELENVVRRYLILRDPEALIRDLQLRTLHQRGPTVLVHSSAPESLQDSAATPILAQVDRAKERAEIDAILAALSSTRWNRKQAAALLGVDYKALLYRMKKLSIEQILNPRRVSQPAYRSSRRPLSRTESSYEQDLEREYATRAAGAAR